MRSFQIRSSPAPATTIDLKQRVIACINRLSDRDTLSLAAAELDSIALNLSPESFSLFINCLQSTDSSARSPVRKHCVSLLSVLSRSHGDSLSPHLPKMVSTLLRRLRDPDSSVRAACAAASVDMITCIPGTPFSILFGPVIETLVHDCDPNAQIGAAMCLAAAVDAAADEIDVEQLQKALPKIGKLLKSDGFKAKPELLEAIGSVISAVGGRNSDKAVLDWLLPNVSEFLSSDDWRARKAAAEAMARVAVAEEELAPLYKKACVDVLESRRFDKVKPVRETMNRTLSLWKQLERDSTEVSESSSSSSKSASSAIPGKRSNGLKGKDRNLNTPIISKLNDVDHLDRNVTPKDVEQEAVESKDKRNHSTMGAKRVLFTEKASKVKENGLKKLQVVQSSDEESPKTDSGSSNSSSQATNNTEELSMIRNQITQIEIQQSSLLDLFQKFMESSQNGMQSLERRVRCLETSFSVISTDLLVSRTITRNGNHKRSACLQD